MEQALPAWIAWTVVAVGYLLPLAHVTLSPSAGPWRAPEGARCPFSPRVGWLVIVLLLGLIGWVMFWRARRRRPPPPTPAEGRHDLKN
ncbi:MAG: hypothetical protein VW405_03280 [Rhodospirillaceae bacterium]